MLQYFIDGEFLVLDYNELKLNSVNPDVLRKCIRLLLDKEILKNETISYETVEISNGLLQAIDLLVDDIKKEVR